MTRFKLPFILVSTVLVVILAWALRARAVQLLPVDYDEDDYMRAAQQYTALIRQGNWADFTQTNYRAEHPPLAKIVFGFSLLQAPPAPLIPDRPTTAGPDQYLPRKQLYAARSIGAVLGTVTVGLLALVNPLAGLLLSIHAMTIKYVSQVMLEALPAFTSLAMVLAYLQSKKQKNKTAWLALSAVFLGLTAASKYLYCVAGIAILVDWFLDFRQDKKTAPPVWTMLLWGLAAVLVFFAADPYLWPDPVGRLKDSILYHANYSTGAAEVQESNFPTWQPLVWLSISPYSWHEGVFVFGIDGLISLFGLLGLTRLWKKSRIYVLWLAIGIVFLLL